MSYGRFEALYQFAIYIESDALVVAFQSYCLAFTWLPAILEVEEVAVTTEAQHSLDRVGEVEGAALTAAKHCAGSFLCPFDVESDGVGITDLS